MLLDAATFVLEPLLFGFRFCWWGRLWAGLKPALVAGLIWLSFPIVLAQGNRGLAQQQADRIERRLDGLEAWRADMREALGQQREFNRQILDLAARSETTHEALSRRIYLLEQAQAVIESTGAMMTNLMAGGWAVFIFLWSLATWWIEHRRTHRAQHHQ